MKRLIKESKRRMEKRDLERRKARLIVKQIKRR